MPFLQTPRERAGFLILALGVAIVVALSPFISGLLGTAVLYVVCVGVYRRLERITRPGIAAVLTLLGAIVVIALPLIWLVSVMIDQAPETLRSVRESPFLAQIAQLRIGRFQVGVEIAAASGRLLTWFSGQAFDFVGSAARASLNPIIAFFGLYYMLRSGEEMWTSVREFIPFSAPTADKLRERTVVTS